MEIPSSQKYESCLKILVVRILSSCGEQRPKKKLLNPAKLAVAPALLNGSHNF